MKQQAKHAKKKSKAGKIAAVIAESVFAVLLILCFSGSLVINSYLDKIRYDAGVKPLSYQEAESSPAEQTAGMQNDPADEAVPVNAAPVAYDKDVYNVLLIGSDTKTPEDRGRSDSMVLVSINRKTSKITMTSLLRDIYLQIPNVALGNRLNAANEFGGPALLLETIRRNFKIQVDKYVAVDFYSFMDIIDQIGGVQVDVSQEEIAAANDSIEGINGIKGLPANDGLLISPGKQTLNGKQALCYARVRSVGNGDFERTQRQRLVLEQVFSKVKTRNLVQLNQFLNSFLPKITTNLTKSDLLSLLFSVPTYAKYTIESWNVPEDGTFSYSSVRGMSVLKIDFTKNAAEMQKKIYG